jgi:hypothetical protein
MAGTSPAMTFVPQRGVKFWLVMPGLVPGIHVLNGEKPKDVDGRDKPGHDVCSAAWRGVKF